MNFKTHLGLLTAAALSLACSLARAEDAAPKLALETPSRAARAEAATLLAQYHQTPSKEAFLIGHAGVPNVLWLTYAAHELDRYHDAFALDALARIAEFPRVAGSPFAPGAVAQEIYNRHSCEGDLKMLREARDGKEQATQFERIYLRCAGVSNDFLHTEIYQFVLTHTPQSPQDLVPVLVKYYAAREDAQKVIVKYPEIAGKCLHDGLHSLEIANTAGCIHLVGLLKQSDLLPELTAHLYAGKDDPQAAMAGQASVWFASADTLIMLGDQSVPALESVLYSGDASAQQDALEILTGIGTPKAKQMVRAFADTYSKKPQVEQNPLVLAAVEDALAAITVKPRSEFGG